jgi:hypothetical protein
MNTLKNDSALDLCAPKEVPCAKLTYTAPALIVLGSAADMTRASTNTVADGTALTGS